MRSVLGYFDEQVWFWKMLCIFMFIISVSLSSGNSSHISKEIKLQQEITQKDNEIQLLKRQLNERKRQNDQPMVSILAPK